MANNKESFEQRNGAPEDAGEGSKKIDPGTITPGDEIVSERAGFLKTRSEILQKETTDRFIDGLEGFFTEYRDTPMEMRQEKYKLSLEGFAVDGEGVKNTGDLKRKMEKDEINISRVEGVFEIKSGDGTKITQRVPAEVVANGTVTAFIENAFSGGTYEKGQKEQLAEAAPKPEITREEEKVGKQVEAIKKRAEDLKGSVSVLEGPRGVTVVIGFPDSQLRLTTIDGAVWSAAKSADNGQTVNPAGSSGDPLDLLPKLGEKKGE